MSRYVVRSEYQVESGKDLFWVMDTTKNVRVGNPTWQAGRAINTAGALQSDWEDAIARLGHERATLIYG